MSVCSTTHLWAQYHSRYHPGHFVFYRIKKFGFKKREHLSEWTEEQFLEYDVCYDYSRVDREAARPYRAIQEREIQELAQMLSILFEA